MASWLAQYMGEPIERAGTVFTPDDFMFYNGELPDEVDSIVLPVDPAFGGGDYVAGPVGVVCDDKIYVADAALRNACLMRFAPLDNESDLGAMVESTVYKHFYAAYGRQGEVGFIRNGARGSNEIDIAVELRNGKRLFCEVKYRNSSELSAQEAIIRQCHESPDALALLATKLPQDYGFSTSPGSAPLLKIPAHTMCYLLN